MNRIAYFKDGVEVARPTSICFGGATYVPPTDEILIEAGYELVEVEIPDRPLPIPTYEEKVVSLIRQRYDINQELSILRQRDSKPTEFEEYYNYCEYCKQVCRDSMDTM